MHTVALTGGLATGKSTVGGYFVELGCHLVQADRLGHETLLPNGAAYPAVVKLFGEEILGPDQQIVRKKLGGIVFGAPDKLAALNAIVHPAVEELRKAEFARIAAADPDAIVLYESAIHIEAGIYKQFPVLILVTCNEELQIQRAMARSGWSRQETLARIAQQMPLATKRKFATYVIDTSDSVADTKQQVAKTYNELRNTFSH